MILFGFGIGPSVAAGLLESWCRRLAATALLAAATGSSLALADDRIETAEFEVTTEVLQPDLAPFTVTMGRLGNGARLTGNGGFEPQVFRNMIVAEGGTETRIFASRSALSNYDSWNGRAFDGAEIEVMRIENGRFRSVRRDRVSPGGYVAAEWLPVDGKTLVAPKATRFQFRWADFNRAGVPYYFTVRAVDRSGRLSAEATAVAATRPPDAGKGSTRPQNATVKAPKLSEGPGGPAAPANLTARVLPDGLLELRWDPVPGAAGYQVYRSDVPPDRLVGSYIQLDTAGPRVEAGDLVFLRTKFYDAKRERLLTNRVWNARDPRRDFVPNLIGAYSDDPDGGNWRLIRHEPGNPVEGAGETHLRVTLLQDQEFRLRTYNHSGLDQTWYEVLRPGIPYRFEVWMRSDRPVEARFELQGFYGQKSGPRVPPFVFRTSGDWRKYSVDFVPPVVDPGGKPNAMALTFAGPGQIDIDNFRAYRTDVPYLALEPQEQEILAASGMSHGRTHVFIKTGRSTYDLDQLTNPAGVSNAPEGFTLPAMLEMLDGAGLDPWIQVEPHLTREEWLALVEYLAAPFDPATDDPASRPWAAKRAKEGHPEPWTDVFDTLYFEIGNETWNRLFRPWVFPPLRDAATGRKYGDGEVYGLFQEYVLGILAESPWWDRLEPGFRAVIGGRARNDYGIDAARVSPHSSLVGDAVYIGGWDSGEGLVRPNPASFSSVLSHVLQSVIPRAEQRRAAVAEINRSARTPLFPGTYESGPGYALRGASGKVTPEEERLQEEVMKSAAAGTATLDSFLAYAEHGYATQNYFTFGAGRTWTSHARWQDGGQTFPAWDLLTFVNREALGDVLATHTLDAPTVDLPEVRRRKAVRNGPTVAAYATRNGDRLSLILVSRRVPDYPVAGDDGRTAVRLALPIRAAARLTRVDQTGRYDSHNLDGKEVRLTRTEVAVPASLPIVDIPVLDPGKTVILLFDGVEWSDR